MTGMSDLVEFLTARLDEDEQVARDAAVDAGGTWKPGAGVWGDLDEVFPVVYDEGRPTPDQAAHIARHDPARVLADVAAKRQLVVALAGYVPADMHFLDDVTASRAHVALLGLTHLALPYADHPDYREEWKP
jgi:hypothetical protein